MNFCSSHSISADEVEKLILTTVQRISRRVVENEDAFAEELQSLWSKQKENDPQKKKDELKRLQRRDDELSDLSRGLYENLVKGLLSERQFKQLMKQYDNEQEEIENQIEQLKASLLEEKQRPAAVDQFISLIRRYKEPAEITDTMLSELIDKIVVHEGDGEGRNRFQQVDIYFNYVGIVNLTYTEEELAELQAKKDQEDADRLARQREREKGYRENRKARKIAENGGPVVKTKICPECGTEFIPASNRQMFCCAECRKKACNKQKKAGKAIEHESCNYSRHGCEISGGFCWANDNVLSFNFEKDRRVQQDKIYLDYCHRLQTGQEYREAAV